MQLTSILVPSLVATTAMTAFSYFYSYIRKKQFREPELLNILLIRWFKGVTFLSKKSILGWLLHYIVGLGFMALFVWIWETKTINPSIPSGLILGFLAGIIGIIGWQMTFWFHPDPPKIKLKEYFLHLIFAHLVFGLSSVLTYYLLQ